MTEKQIKVIAEYTGRTKIHEAQVSESKDYLKFTGPGIEEIKISADNPVISGLLKRSPETLKLGRKYELVWHETDSQPKRVFEKGDVIVLVAQEEENDNKIAKKAGDCSKCKQKYVSEKSNGAGDKKIIIHGCSQKDDQQNDEENNDNNSNNKIAEKSAVRKYCQDNNIEKLEYDEEAGKLVIIYKKNSNKSKNELEVDNLNKESKKLKITWKRTGIRTVKVKKWL